MKFLWVVVGIAVLAVIVTDPWFVETVLPVIGWGMAIASWSALCWALGRYQGRRIGWSNGYRYGHSAGKGEARVQARHRR